MVEEFHFLRPNYLWLFAVLLIFIVLLYKKARQSNSWMSICDPQLVSHLLVGQESRSSITPMVLLLVVGSLLILAMAGPTWQKLPQAVFKTQDARMYVIDLSRSMDATDIAPSRATLAKLKLIDFLKSHKEGQIGLIAFAGQAHVVSPLTDDANTIISMVPSLSTDIMPVQGSSPDKAMQLAGQLLKQAGNPSGDIVLITDGVDLTTTLEVAQQMVINGYQLHVLGVGTQDGAPIPIGQGGFLKDNSGAIVIPKLDSAELKELALAGGGKYVNISIDDSDIKKLNKSTRENLANKESEEFREVDLWRDEGHWLLIAALPLAALGFRRGWLGVLVISLSILPVDESLAFEWADLWQRKDQQAEELLKNGDAANAAKMFENKEWKGTAHYREGNYEKAAETFSKIDSVDAKYNYANALAKQGKFQEAIDIYNQLIEKQPEHNDAIFNRELLKKAMQQQQQQQSQEGEDDKQEQSQDEQNAQSENQDQQADSQQQSEAEQQEQAQSQDQNQDQSQQSSNNEPQNAEEQKQSQASEQDEQSEAEKREQELRREQESEKGEQAEREKQQATEEQSSENREIRQATEQWLRRIPDDPGGLMREKFHRQSQRNRQRSNVEKPW